MIENLVNHMYWANSIIINWIQQGQNRVEELRLTSHILNAERVWISRANHIQGDKDIFKVHQVESLFTLNNANYSEFSRLLHTDLKKDIDYQLFNGSPGKTSIENMIIHAFSHGFHHVGQLAAITSGKGEKFPDVSYLGFTRQNK